MVTVRLERLGQNTTQLNLKRLGKNYSVVKAWRSLEKLGQTILVVYKISTRSWGLEVGKWFGRTSIKISCVNFSISYLVI